MKNNLKDLTLQEVKDLCAGGECDRCPLNLPDNDKPYNYCVFMKNVQDPDVTPSDIKIDFSIPQRPLTKEQLYFLYGAYMMGAQYILPPKEGNLLYKCRVDVSTAKTQRRFSTPDALEFEKSFFSNSEGAILIDDLLKAGGMFG